MTGKELLKTLQEIPDDKMDWNVFFAHPDDLMMSHADKIVTTSAELIITCNDDLLVDNRARIFRIS